MPQPSPEFARNAEKADNLLGIMEQASNYFRINLETKDGMQARAYLSDRKLSDEMRAAFGIGYALDGRDSLFMHLSKKGIAKEKILEAGLVALPDSGGTPYDRFRDRIIFPIRDSRNRTIAFGGRAMNPAARAKYLNSPDTPLFKKGDCLFNFAAARDTCSANGELILAEGYMDVIALASAGFASVAPLGTSVTESQLRLLWRIAPEPIIALDGDSSGIAAAKRIMDIAIPNLGPNRTLKFCLLPRNLDPDDIIREQGRAAMAELISRSLPFIKFLWNRETQNREISTPEHRQQISQALHASVRRIEDPDLREGYRQHINRELKNLWENSRQSNQIHRGKRSPTNTAMPARETATSVLARGKAMGGIDRSIQQSAILGICITFPEIVTEFLDRLEAIEMGDSKRDEILRCLLTHALAPSADTASLRMKIAERVGEQALTEIFQMEHVTNIPAIRLRKSMASAATLWPRH